MENNIKKGKKKIFIFLLGMLVIGIIWLFYWFFYGRIHISTEDSYVSGNQTIITSQVSGTISEVFVEETQKVKEGDLLMIIDDSDIQIELKIAEAQLGTAVKKYFNLQEQIGIAQDQVEESENNLRKATDDYNRDLKSYKVGLISKEKLESTVNIYENSKISLKKSRLNLKNIQNEAYSQDIYTHPLVAEAISNYKKAFLNLERSKIYSPVSGIAAKKNVFVGQQIHSGENIITVIDLENIWIDANYKETEMGKFKIGNSVELTSDYNGKKYSGYISGISSASGSSLSLLPAQNASGNWIKVVQRVPVRINISRESLDKNGVIPLGTSVSTTVKIKEFYSGEHEKEVQKSTLYALKEKEFQGAVEEIIKNNSFSSLF